MLQVEAEGEQRRHGEGGGEEDSLYAAFHEFVRDNQLGRLYRVEWSSQNRIRHLHLVAAAL